MMHINSSLPDGLDSLQFTICATGPWQMPSPWPYTSPWNKDTNGRLMIIDCSSAFNIQIPTKHIQKFVELGLSTPLHKWILDFLTDKMQSVRIGYKEFFTIILNITTMQGSFQVLYDIPYTFTTLQPNSALTRFTSWQMTPKKRDGY